jgi:iron complex outermembrane receptor protein
LSEDNLYNFVNPKAGIYYDLSPSTSVYASYAVGNKEPNRSDFVDSPNDQTPLHESLQNIEVGYKQTTENMKLQANFYLMDYRNQLVLTGQLNDVGSSLRTNVDKSMRMGLELEASANVNPILAVSGHVTFSNNTIKSFDEVIYDYGAAWDEYNTVVINHKNTQISFSPSLTTAASIIVRPYEGIELAWIHKYVGKQYLDNTTDENRKIDGYYISDARLSYELAALGMKRISFNLAAYNLFNKMYESNGYTWGYQGGGNDIRENFYFPQAGTHFMAGITIEL